MDSYRDLSKAWLSIPGEVRRQLLLGSYGTSHLVCCAGQALREDPPLARLAAELLQAAWESDPLDCELAASLSTVWEARGIAPDPGIRQAVGAVAASAGQQEDLRYYQGLLAKRELAKERSFLASKLARKPGNLFWLRRAALHAQVRGQGEWLLGILPETWPARVPEDWPVAWHGELAPVAWLVAGEVRSAAGLWAEAAEFLAKAVKGLPWGEPRVRLAEALLRSGDRDNALRFMSRTLSDRPWHTSLALRLGDLLTGCDALCCPIPGSTEVLLYTYNKADLLDTTCASLAASHLDGARITILDNGSTDRTSNVVKAWGERFGEAIRTITLPVNVGAPAARNWLANDAAARGADFVAYLDDDTLVPPDWLERFGAAVERYPGAGVWGCKVVESDSPGLIQCADLHLLFPPRTDDAPDIDLSLAEPNPFGLSDLHKQSSLSGRFEYMRPCVSVTGCCHLFRIDRLIEAGGFSLHLSPSQYDDLEHDLRQNACGLQAIYQGHLQVRHAKISGKLGQSSLMGIASAKGNLYKLQAFHPPDELTAIARRDEQSLEVDLLARFELVSTFCEVNAPALKGKACWSSPG